MHKNNQFNYEEEDTSEVDVGMIALRSSYKQTFNTEHGQAVLENLKELTLDQPVAHPDFTHAFACYRQGQNDIVRRIINLMGEPKE